MDTSLEKSLAPATEHQPENPSGLVSLQTGTAMIAQADTSLEAQAPSQTLGLSPTVTTARSPQFDQLRGRLLSDTAQPLPVEAVTARAARRNALSNAQTVAVEEVKQVEEPDADATEAQSDAQPDSFIESPTLTLDGFRALVEEAEVQQAEAENTETAEASGTRSVVAQNDEEDALPTLLEESEPTAPESTDIEEDPAAPETPPEPPTETPTEPPTEPPEVSPTEVPDTEREPASAGPDESVPAPTAADDVEIDELPAILYADRNPLSFPTTAEEVDIEQNPVITLEQAIELAYRNNQTLQAALLSQQQAAAAVDEARAALLPSVTTQADLTTRENTQIDPFTGDSSSDLDTTLGGSVSINYDLITGGSREASIRAAELNEEIATLAVEAQQEQIRLTTATSYYALQEAGENIGINQSFLDEAARNLRDAQLRQEVGVGTRFDVLRAEVQFANARQQVIQSQSQQQISRRDISRLLNLPPNASVSATPVAKAANWPLTLEESIVLAFQNRAELEQQLLQADVSEQQRRAALAALRPQVSLFANYSIPDVLDTDGELQDTYSLGAQLNWTLFDGGAARARARQQSIGSDIAEEQFSENLDQVRFDVEQSFFNLQASEENISTSEIAVSQAEEALALANLRLQAGVGTQLDVLTAQRELADARGNNVTAILGYNRALVSIERAISNVAAPL
ncbi:MAG: TolC family protein [Phormidesmis sp.]